MQRASPVANLSPLPRRAFAGLLMALVAPIPLLARSHSVQSYAHAEHLREVLEHQPPSSRTWNDYERVLDAYRAIYHGNPAAPRADASIMAVADLLAEEGRHFHDQKRSLDAIGQYEFLRSQYPRNPFRASALLSEGEIWQHDLHDPGRARSTYQKFLRLYPRSEFAAEARADLRSLHTQVARNETPEPAMASLPSPRPSHPVAKTVQAQPDRERAEVPPAPGPISTPVADDRTAAAGEALPQITGIRHWSTAVYTRVAIDLQKEVRYEAVRVAHPDRIYFDLYGAQLSPQLRMRPDDRTKDGFLRSVRATQLSPEVSRIVLNVSSLSEYSAFFLPNPPRLIIDVHGSKAQPNTEVARTEAPPVPQPARTEPQPPQRSAARREAKAAPAVTTGVFRDPDDDTLSRQPDQVRATRYPTTSPVAASVAGTTPATQPEHRQPRSARADVSRASVPPPRVPATETIPSPSGVPTSMVRALGLKINRIVIDAGHGGHDSGAIGVGGLEEKNVVLDVALRLGRLLHDRLGSDVIYTRSTDTFIPLETRTAIANQDQADLFISIHANSSSDPTVRGIETYYLNFTTSTDALDVAARENAVSDESIHQLSSLVKKIALQSKIDESREFASDVDQSLYRGLERDNSGLENRGVKKAPFVVLIGANMPSILVEISFLTNPTSADDLRRAAYRERIAESLYRGVAQYVGSLNGVRVAQAGTRPDSSE